MAELESAIEKSLIDKLCHDKSQWTYRADIKTEEQLWNNFKYILEQNNKAKLNDVPLSESEFAKIKNDISHASFYEAGKWLVGENGKVYVLEANPRASRTVPLVSKVCNVRMVPLAIDIVTSELTGRKSPVPELKEQDIPYYGVKEAVFPFNMFQEVDPVLGPEMRSTGEVLGLSRFYGEAFFKAQEATQTKLPLEGTVLITVNDKDKDEVVDLARDFADTGFKILASKHTGKLIQDAGIEVEIVNKLQEGRPNILDLITNGKIDLIVNTPIGKDRNVDDSYLRKAAIKKKVPYMTTMAAAKATVSGIQSLKKPGCGEVKSLQELHSEIKDK